MDATVTPIPIRYAIIRYQPYVETEEFANIGVVLVAPKLDVLDFRLETKRIARLTGFFDALEPSVLRHTLKNYSAELSRIRSLTSFGNSEQKRLQLRADEAAEHLFASLTKDREGIVRFSDVRYAIHENPTKKLNELFDQYVTRTFADSEYKERLLEKQVRHILSEQGVSKKFSSRRYSDGLYSLRFSFVAENQGHDTAILKPIFLGQNEPTRIFDHANKWLFGIGRLRSRLPKNITFAVEGPASLGPAREAFEEVTELFFRNDIDVVNADGPELRNLARTMPLAA